MVHLFHGDNNYDSWHDLLALLEKSQSSYSILEGIEINSLDAIFKNVDNFSFFGGTTSTAIVIKRLSACKSLTVFKALEEKLKEEINFDLYLWEPDTLDKTSKILRIGKKYGQVKLFKTLDKMIMKKFVNDKLKEYDLIISEKVMGELLSVLAVDKYQIEHEIMKLANLAKGLARHEILQEDLSVVSVSQIESQIWDLTEAISKKDKKKALDLVNRLFKRNEDFPLIVAALTNQLELLYLMKLNLPREEIIAKFKIHPFVWEKNKYFAKNFSEEQLKMLFSKLANLDFNIKQGKIDARLGLNLLMLTI